MTGFVSFKDLPRPDETNQPLGWGIWGKDDELGTLNHITDEVARAATASVRRGKRFNLDLPIHLPFDLITEGAFGERDKPTQTLFEENYRSLLLRDDKLDGFFLQGSTQWDGLTHIGTPALGFYNGVKPEQVRFDEGSKNGIDKVADFGIVTRGLLVDFVRYFKHLEVPWAANGYAASADDVSNCLRHQGVSPRPGDILLFRFGWLAALFNEPDQAARNSTFSAFNFSGIAGDQAMWEFLWDNKIAAAAGDNPTLESAPMAKQDNLHQMIVRMGFTIGEFFALDALAEDCANDGVYEFMLTSSPLNIRGGVGSPPNAIAVK